MELPSVDSYEFAVPNSLLRSFSLVYKESISPYSTTPDFLARTNLWIKFFCSVFNA